MCFVSTLIFKLKNGFVDLFKKCKISWEQNLNKKKYGGQNGNENV
jgi:hypothetical protein